MPDKPNRLDVTHLAALDLPESAFPGQGKKSFRVYFDPKIHDRIAAHAAEKLTLEICGVLLGHWQRDEEGPFVLVNEAIRADKAQSNAGDVTFTHDAWNDIHREMDTKYTDRQIVGWYHSHPNFGIFLSDRDCFIHEHFFNSPGQVAYVVDPVNGVEGVFCWRNGKAKLFPHFWVGDEIHLSSQGKERQPSSAPPPETSSASAPARQEAPQPVTMLTLLLAAACTLLLGYLLGGMKTSAEQRNMELGAVTYYGRLKGLKPGMREDMEVISGSLQAVLQKALPLAKEHIALVGDSKDAKDAKEEKAKQWEEVLQRLAATTHAVDQVNNKYSLTPGESAELQALIDDKETEAATGRAPASSGTSKPSGSQSSPKSSGEAAAAKSSADKSVPAAPVPAH